MDRFQDQTILVTGAAGISGQAISRLLLELGAHLILVDQDDGRELHSDIRSHLSHGHCTDLRPRQDVNILHEYTVDMVVVAPGISMQHPLFQEARVMDIPLRGEIDLASQVLSMWARQKKIQRPPIVAITGTDGKSTTTALLSHIVNCSTNATAISAGNFGFPLALIVLALLTNKSAVDPEEQEIFRTIRKQPEKLVLVIENSSFQLELLQYYQVDVALLLNIAEDHLDRYPNMQSYVAAKLNLTEHLVEDGLAIVGSRVINFLKALSMDLPACPLRVIHEDQVAIQYENNSKLEWQGVELIQAQHFAVPCQHNYLNLAFGLAALEELLERFSFIELQLPHLKDALLSYKGLDHRMQIVLNQSGVVYINDSKATTVQACLQALQCFKKQNVLLLIGGRAKETDFRPLYHWTSGHSVQVLAYGESAPLLAGIFNLDRVYADLAEAFAAAQEIISTTKRQSDLSETVLLLSPACASYDAYANFKKRGQHFMQLVDALKESR